MRRLLTAFVALLAAGNLPAADADAKSADFFEKHIRPVLARDCFSCHSAAAPVVKAGLRLDSRAGMLKGGSRGPAIVPGKPADSLLLKALRQEGPKMPPKGKLTDTVIADFTAWIAAGAVYPAAPAKSPADSLWSLTPPKKYAPPAVQGDWAWTDVDRFVQARMQAEGLKPVGDAAPAALLRRAAFDITGLPPTPEEVDAFLKEPTRAAFEKAVDRMLASPAFGEKWGRHWLDIARYAESNGNADNVPFEHAWRYRDYVIDSFNKDKPYDRFVTEQLAGDLLPGAGPPRDELLVATGFLAMMSKPRAQNNPNYEMDIVAEQIEVTGAALMGLTVGCARCHDHKYDPITTREYYGLAGVFTSTDLLAGAGGKGAAKPKKGGGGKNALHDLAGDGSAMGVRDGKAADCAICVRGESNDRGPVVPRGVPAALAGPTPPKMPANQSGRLELAKWLTSGTHPLTARVMVNRVWRHVFGRGIVPTVDNFGTLGEKPTHPELLDTLAVRFVEDGWSVKRLIRSLVLTRTYGLAGDADAVGLAKDPAGVYLWRASPRRLEAEAIRDAILVASGQLDAKKPTGSTSIPSGNKKLPATQKDNRFRSVYLPAVRGAEPEAMALFDAADSTLVIGSRDVTTVPSQALYLLNGPFVVEQSRHAAKRLADAGASADRVGLAWRLVLSRPPTDAERERASAFVAATTSELSAREKDRTKAEAAAWAALCQALFASAEFRYLN